MFAIAGTTSLESAGATDNAWGIQKRVPSIFMKNVCITIYPPKRKLPGFIRLDSCLSTYETMKRNKIVEQTTLTFFPFLLLFI